MCRSFQEAFGELYIPVRVGQAWKYVLTGLETWLRVGYYGNGEWYGRRRDESRKIRGGGSECTVKGFTCYTMGFGFYSANVVEGGP